MPDDGPAFEVYALRYASRTGRKGAEFYRFEHYGEPDEAWRVDYFFWLARNASRIVLVDCGYNFDRAAAKGLYLQNDLTVHPAELLQKLGIRVDDVGHVVLSHMHLDHIGNAYLFPNAHFSVARREYDFWTGGGADKELLATAVDRADISYVRYLHETGRLHLVDDRQDVFPGLSVTCVGGHTPGQMIAEIQSGAGSVVLASDASHFYEEFQSDRPFWLFTDMVDMYAGYERLRELDSMPGVTVVPGHDPRVMDRFNTVHRGEVVDLTKAGS